MIRLGIDLGGSKIEIIALDAAGKTLLRERVATPRGDENREEPPRRFLRRARRRVAVA